MILPRKRRPAQNRPSRTNPATPLTITEKTKGLRKIDGFFPLYWDERAGKLFLKVERLDSDFLYQVALASGLGSNPVGLDRGQLGESKVVFFRRIGPKVLLIERNLKYRALSDNPAERRAVEESFASSVQGGFKVEAEEKGRILVDATDFFLHDAHGVAERLRTTNQGNYKLDNARSSIDPSRTKGFARNTEVEAILTFATDGEAGKLVAETAASGQVVTVRVRHSLVALPPLDGSFKPRKADPRVGVCTVDFYDFATPFDRTRRAAVDRPAPAHQEGPERGECPTRSNRSSTTLTRVRPSRFARHSSRGLRGGSQPSRRRDSRTPSGSKCCRPMPTRWTFATT